MEAAFSAPRESKKLDFKRTVDLESAGDWCELVKDIVAMANSGGGTIVIGANDDGTPADGFSTTKMLSLDPAVITDKVAKYTGNQFDGVSIVEAERQGRPVAAVIVAPASSPLVFERPGTYELSPGKQRTAFSQGTVYVRHGAKSAPATTADLARIVDRRVQEVRKQWMSGVRKVVTAPRGARISVSVSPVQPSINSNATPIRITHDPAAPEYRLVDPDITHPWRQKELMSTLNAVLPNEKRVNGYHIRAVRHLFGIDARPEFFYKSKYASPRYSPAFYEWLIGRYNISPDFFTNAAEEMSRQTTSS